MEAGLRTILATTSMMLLVAVAASRFVSPSASAAGQAQPAPAPGMSGNIEHGRYITHNVAMCVECHSPRDGKGNIIESQAFYGAPVPVGAPSWASDWAIIAPRNRGLPGYDDAQAMRLLTEGAIGRDGKQLRPPMPRFHMTKQDAADVIAYLRSLK